MRKTYPHDMPIKPSAVDLFCGCGGLTTGLKQAGFQVIGAVDIDPLSIKTFKANHKKVHVWKIDIRKLDPSEILNTLKMQPGVLDLLAGCPPCQGFSTMRTRNGGVSVDDPRNDLLEEFERFVAEIRPKTIMLENVPGLAEDKRFADFLVNMKKLGYLGNHSILNASEYGVPQRRRRLIYLAGMNMEIPLGEKSEKKITVRAAIGALPAAGHSGDPLHDLPEKRTPKIQKLIRQIPKDGGSRKDLPEAFHLECHKKCDGFKDVYGRMAWDQPAPTITSGCFNPSKGRFLHPEKNRAITMREAALLQGFPPGYKFPAATNKSAIALMIGNALPPPFIAIHGKSIKYALQSKKTEIT